MRGLRPSIRALTSANVRVVRNAGTTPAEPAAVELFLYEEVGPWGVTALDFARAFAQVGRSDRVTLRLNSPGGDVFDGLAIYNLLRGHPGGVDVRVDGLAASAASFIAMSGETVTMAPHTRMMIHDASTIAWGNAAELRDLADLLDDTSQNIAGIYADRSGGSADAFRELMVAETWLDGPAAVELGIVDVAESAAVDGEGDGSTSVVPGEGDDEGDAGALNDDEQVDALFARWRESFTYAATAGRRTAPVAPARPAARRAPQSPPAPPAVPSPAAEVDLDGIRSILKGLPR